MSDKGKLEVIIDKQDSKYFVTVSWGGLRENAEFIPPYSEDSLIDTIKKIGRLDKSGKPKASNEQLRNIGLETYKSLFPSEELRKILVQCLLSGEGMADMDLRYRDPEIGRIPWELLHDGKSPLVASGKLNLVRVLEAHEPFTGIVVKSPLKILVVVARPLDQPPLEKAPPMERMVNELRSKIVGKKIAVHFLVPPTRDMFVKSLGRGYDIVQFYGHGGFFKRKGCLAFENDLGLTQLVSADELAVMLQGVGIQLVVLCACHSAETEPSDTFTGVAQSLVGACVPAVLGWNFAVPVETALAFMEQFYASLASDKKPSVRRAVAQARKALYSRGTAHFPMLFERTTDDRLTQKGSWDEETLQSPYEEPPNNFAEPLGIHSQLVGRFRDLRELANALASPETVVAIWGFSGVGKTALAVRGVYDRFLWRFPDGAWYVELQGGKVFDTILSELCRHMGIALVKTFEEKEQLVLDRLAQTKTLLLMNNFEDVETDQELVSFLNRVRQSSKVLLTSRHEPQQIAWRRYELREMNPMDALTLFLVTAERAHRSIEISELDVVAEICRRLDYYPIAINYIAGSFEGKLEDVMKELDEKPPDPVRAGFEYAYGKLSAGARDLLARLSIFRRPFRKDAIKALAIPTEHSLQLVDWDSYLKELRRVGLLLFSENWYSMLTMTRQLASEHLKEPQKWHSIAADHYLSPETFSSLRAFDHLLASERWKEAVETINAATRLYSYGLAGEVEPRLEVAARLAVEKLSDPQLQGYSLGCLGLTLEAQGKYEEALAKYEEALLVQRSILKSDPNNVEHQSDVAMTLNNLGNVQGDMGRFEVAENSFNEALQIRRVLLKSDPNNVEHQSDVAMTLNNLGNVQGDMGRFEVAENSYNEALQMIKDLHEGDPENLVYKQRVVSVLHSVSLLFEEKNDTERSVLATQSIIDESRYMQYVKGEAWGFLWLAELQLVKKDYVKAEEARRDALRLADENNLFDVRDEALIVQGKILIAKGRTDEALTCFSEACIASLEHKMDIHIAIVNKVVSFLKRLAYEGNKEVACQIGKHLVESWKKKQLDQKTPQFIKYIEEQMGKLQS